MKLNNYWQGIIFSFASAACISVTFTASNEALKELSSLAFSPLWFAAASAWGLLFYLWRNGFTFPVEVKQYARPILLMAVVNELAILFLFYAISLGDPTLVAFFANSKTIYGVLLGAFVLGERILYRQWLGIAITVVAAGVITFRSGKIVLLMLLSVLIGSFFFALSNMIVKHSLTAVPPLVLSIARTLIMAGMAGVIALIVGQLSWPTLTTWLWIAGGAFMGPFLSHVFLFKALLHFNLSKVVVIRATQPLFVAVYGLILFGSLITNQQFLGGLLMLGGVMLMLSER